MLYRITALPALPVSFFSGTRWRPEDCLPTQSSSCSSLTPMWHWTSNLRNFPWHWLQKLHQGLLFLLEKMTRQEKRESLANISLEHVDSNWTGGMDTMWFTLKKLFPICNGSTINLGYWESMHATETDNGHEKHASKSAKFHWKSPVFWRSMISVLLANHTKAMQYSWNPEPIVVHAHEGGPAVNASSERQAMANTELSAVAIGRKIQSSDKWSEYMDMICFQEILLIPMLSTQHLIW